MKRYVVGFAWFALAACGSEQEVSMEAFSATPTYDRDIKPMYERYCVECHARQGLKSGGVELDTYTAAFGTSVRSACTSVRQDLVERFASSLQPRPYSGEPPRGTCADWDVFSMPTGVKDKLTRHEQVILLRWVETGAPR